MQNRTDSVSLAANLLFFLFPRQRVISIGPGHLQLSSAFEGLEKHAKAMRSALLTSLPCRLIAVQQRQCCKHYEVKPAGAVRFKC